jgi:hypothetical protein
MPPVQVTTFNETYQAYKNYYIARNGSNKFEKIYDVVTNHSECSRVLQVTVNQRITPSAGDFLTCIFSMSYFIIAKNESRAMGALVFIYYWNERVNKTYGFATEQQLSQKITSIFGQLSMY